MSVAIKLPSAVRQRYGIPTGAAFVQSSWPMSEGRFGLWVGVPGSTQVWPVTGVSEADARKWMNLPAEEVDGA